MKRFLRLLLLLLSIASARGADTKPPVHFAIFGLVHDHAYGFFPLAKNHGDAQLVGIVEPDRELCARFARRFNLDSNLFFPTLDALLAKTNVDAVATFTSTFDHKRVVEMCAPHQLTVMMEKPLAVNLEHARAIEKAAKENRIQIIVNYETTWYPGNQAAYKMIKEDNAIGDLRKIVAHDGHRGPREIGCSETFLKWLTDPVLNGGGALPDFGCYGADLMTWLMDGQRPTSVFAVTQHIKPEVYPKVEDEATIVVTYPKAQGIIEASWNWAIARKDLEIYGTNGYILVPRRDELKMQKIGGDERQVDLTNSAAPGQFSEPLSYLIAVARGDTKSSGLSSLELNMVVTEILDAARKSAKTGKRIDLPSR